MAARYWVGGTNTWDATAGTKWALTSGGAGGQAVPTASDDVFFDSASGANTVTVAATSVCLSLNCTGFTGTLTGSSGVTISGNLTLGSGITMSYSGTLSFNATSAKTITSNGKSMACGLAFNGAAGSWALQDNLTTTGAITLTQGTLDINSKVCTVASLVGNNSNTRAIAFGTGSIVLTGSAATILNFATATSFSYTGTPTITANYSGSTGTRVIGFGNTAGGTAANALNVAISAGGDAVTLSTGSVFNSLSFSGYTGTVANGARTIYGDLTLGTSMTLTGGANATTFGAMSGTKTITSNGVTMDFPLTFDGSGGTWQLADTLTQGSGRTLTLTNGTLNANGTSPAIGFFALGAGTKTLTLGSGDWTCAGGWDAAINVSGLTVSAATGRILMTSASGKTFAGGGKTWPTLVRAGAGALTVAGANTFADIRAITSGSTVTLPASTTTTATAFNLNGSSGSLVTLQSSSAGSAATLSVASGTVAVSYLSIKDITASGGATFTAVSSTDATGNTGWSFATVVEPTRAPSSGMGLGAALGFSGGSQRLDSGTKAYTDAHASQESTTIKRYLDTFIRGLKADGTWDKIDRGFVKLSTEQASLVDIKQPTKSWINNGCTYQAANFKGNGTTAFLDAGEALNFAGNNYALNSAFLLVYVNEVGSSTGAHRIFGTTGGTTANVRPSKNAGVSPIYQINDATNSQAGLTATRNGSFGAVRTSSTVKRIYQNASNLSGDITSTSTSISSGNATVLRANTDYSDDGVSAAFYGGALTDTQMISLQNRLQTLMTALGRNYGVVFDPAVTGSIYVDALYGESNANNHSEGQTSFYTGMQTALVPYRAFSMNNDAGPSHMTVNSSDVWYITPDGWGDGSQATALTSLRDDYTTGPTNRGPLGQGIMHALAYMLDAEFTSRSLSLRYLGAVVGGQGGRTIDELKKNGTLYLGADLYTRLINMLTRYQTVASSAHSKTIVINSVMWDQGINDRLSDANDSLASFLSDVSSYKTKTLALFANLSADVKAITGQGASVPVLFQQCTGSGTGARLQAPQAQYEIALNSASSTIVPCRPRYGFPFASLSHHSVAGAVERGESYALDLADIRQGLTPRCLLARTFALNSNVITFKTYDRQTGADVTSQIDTTSLPDTSLTDPTSKYGFKVTSDNGVTISSVSAGSSVTITLSGVPVNCRLSYAESGPGNNSGATGLAGQWGNIRDASGVSSRLVAGFTHRNWLWSFAITLS